MTVNHTIEEDFQHFLTYSGLSDEVALIGILRQAFYAGVSGSPSVEPKTQEEIRASIEEKSRVAFPPLGSSDGAEPAAKAEGERSE